MLPIVNQKRTRVLKDAAPGSGPVVYWMSRDQRVRDNWALLYAQDCALERKVPFAVVFCLVPSFLHATIRHFGFMLQGLIEVERNLLKKNIPFIILSGSPPDVLPSFIAEENVGILVTDFDPLRIKRGWKDKLSKVLTIPFYEVDAHNIVPCWHASSKQDFAARTLRPKIKRHLEEFLEEFPTLKGHAFQWKGKAERVDWPYILDSLSADRTVPEVGWIKPGESMALEMFTSFLSNKLESYDELRNDPTKDGQSTLSPYLHFGQISAQRIALEVQRSGVDVAKKSSFLEELIVRRELSDNFCFYNDNYDSVKGFPSWSLKTQREHANDQKDYLYTVEQFERAETHDELWNAAQMEMVKKGKMHGYMRMYWAKKILEWSPTPEDAMSTALYLNDRYELDGRDPSGYTGCAWSIGGVHDRAWFERPIFGKIRYMNYNGCRSKFNVGLYIKRVQNL
ncbi:MAG: deoxyribodipyrimidine photo-lyase [Deltaproteobacteria bacterium]|nr:deoxyribodipyrimidine photo-lyase [Deltaproteobacteria bacterium]MBN2845106.1 deoxyribodipyrimidine photo-lyase [Deltaproteobacteria bacterium]